MVKLSISHSWFKKNVTFAERPQVDSVNIFIFNKMEFKYINPEYISSVSGGDKDILSELFSLFKEQVADIAGEMESLMSAGDFYTLGLLAHKAKSSVAIMGMNDLASMLKTFELQAKAGTEQGNYESYIIRFKDETKVAVAELEEYIKNL